MDPDLDERSQGARSDEAANRLEAVDRCSDCAGVCVCVCVVGRSSLHIPVALTLASFSLKQQELSLVRIILLIAYLIF